MGCKLEDRSKAGEFDGIRIDPSKLCNGECDVCDYYYETNPKFLKGAIIELEKILKTKKELLKKLEKKVFDMDKMDKILDPIKCPPKFEDEYQCKPEMPRIKQVIVLCTELGMRRGKMVAQGCHVSTLSLLEAISKDRKMVDDWLHNGYKKVALEVQTQDILKLLYEQAKDAGLPCAITVDYGLTQIPAGSTTAMAIGPFYDKDIDKITGNLKLLQ